MKNLPKAMANISQDMIIKEGDLITIEINKSDISGWI
jgi:hypothetical protein